MFNPIHAPAQADSSKSASFSGRPAIPEGSALASALTKAGAVALTLLIAASGSAAFSQSEKTRFEDFGAFLQRTRTAHRSDLLSSSGAKVRDTAAFEEMRKAILDRYEGVHVTHSFLLGEQHYDCVPIDEQPAVRNFHLSGIASPPPAERTSRPDRSKARSARHRLRLSVRSTKLATPPSARRTRCPCSATRWKR